MFSKVNTDVMAKNLEEMASKEQKQNQDKEITNTGDVEESQGWCGILMFDKYTYLASF